MSTKTFPSVAEVCNVTTHICYVTTHKCLSNAITVALASSVSIFLEPVVQAGQLNTAMAGIERT